MAANISKTNSNKNCFGVKPEDYIFEDEWCYVFDELSNPQAAVHFVVVPKKHIPRLCDAGVEHEKQLGHLLVVAMTAATAQGLHKTGYHVIVDEDRAGLKSVHLFGRALQHMIWPLGPGARL